MEHEQGSLSDAAFVDIAVSTFGRERFVSSVDLTVCARPSDKVRLGCSNASPQAYQATNLSPKLGLSRHHGSFNSPRPPLPLTWTLSWQVEALETSPKREAVVGQRQQTTPDLSDDGGGFSQPPPPHQRTPSSRTSGGGGGRRRGGTPQRQTSDYGEASIKVRNAMLGSAVCECV